MKKIKAGAVLLTLVMIALFCPLTAAAAEDNTILAGVHIGTADVSGMTREQAQEAVETLVNQMMESNITLHMLEESYTTTASSLGYYWSNQDVVDEALAYGKTGNIVSKYKIRKDMKNSSKVFPVEATVDNQMIQEILTDNCTKYDKRVKNMGLVRENGTFTVIEGETGHQLNVGASVNAISLFMTNEWTGGDADINLIEEIQEPIGSAEELAQITDKLGEGSTDYGSSSSKRVTNVENGASKINGTVLYPGESFSTLDALLPFEKSNGYAEAASYLNGEVIDSVGGGACQVSTTLYLAVMRAELQIDERCAHSMKVNYVKPSMDAAVAEGSKDLIFTNNTDAPVYLEAVAYDGTIRCTVYGKESRSPNREVTYESETIESNDPKVALEARLWKIVRENGQETRTEYNHSTYYVKNVTPNS